MYKSSSRHHHLVDSRKEKEMKVDEALDELRRKGFSWERVNEYYKRQSEWWKECDRVNKKVNIMK